MSIHYEHEAIATFSADTDTIFRYMRTGDHPHAAFKRHDLVSATDDFVTLEAELFNPDGSTFNTRIEHRLTEPKQIESTMIGGAFDGATFRLTYTPVDGRVKVDVEGEFPEFPGMPESDELQMIDGFFTQTFAEDEETLRTWA